MVKEASQPSTGLAFRVQRRRPEMPVGNLVEKCPKCKEILIVREWEKNLKVCTRCEYHFKLSPQERIELLVDAGSFVEHDADIISLDPLHFVARSKDEVQAYAGKLESEREKTGINEAVIIGHATIEEMPLVLAVMSFQFIGGSMGSVVGEKITRAIELAIARHLPLLIVTTSGGARMQEGLYSLMQMAKTSAALARLSEARLPYFCLLTDPTTGGVTASFAMLGDVILAEPGALVCFAGPRVIEQSMYMKLPEGAVTSEFVLQHGMIDAIVHRRDLRHTLAQLLRLYAPLTMRQTGTDQAQSGTNTNVQLPTPSSQPQRTGGSDGIRPGI